MCGIIGYTGNRQARDIIISGLKRLEYRGYDSAGIVIGNGKLQLIKDKGGMAHLDSIVPEMNGQYGIGHTRWATHGPPLKNNSHPHFDCKEQIALVHNGIIENNVALREELMKKGHVFRSETDSEVAVHLLEEFYVDNLEEAMQKTVARLEGSYALAAIHASEKGKIVGARNISPLVVGVGKKENFLASDVPAILEYTDRMIYLLDREIVILTKEEIRIMDFDGAPVSRQWQKVKMNIEGAEKSGYKHFMLKEIFEQPDVIVDTLIGANLNTENGYSLNLQPDTIKIIACGTSYHAGYVGKYLFEEFARTPTTVEIASEYRFSSATTSNPLIIGISQSGETTDTLVALKTAKTRGLNTLGIVNIVGSTMTRETNHVFYTRAGLEVGVAATKTYITQLIALLALAVKVGVAKEILGIDDARYLSNQMRKLPRHVRTVLDNSEQIIEIAREISDSKSMFFLGRNINFPVALEGALKMKEISYIHAEGYPAAEMKHGPIALIDEEMPVVVIAPRKGNYDKLVSNVQEVKARKGKIISIITKGDKEVKEISDYSIEIPDVEALFVPFIATIPLQFLSYYIAVYRGCNVDQPRNLAKSVTVE